MQSSIRLHYLEASHEYYLNFELPFIRRELKEALDDTDNLARLILRLYDEFADEVRVHMEYEEQNVFPYVEVENGRKPQHTE